MAKRKQNVEAVNAEQPAPEATPEVAEPVKVEATKVLCLVPGCGARPRSGDCVDAVAQATHADQEGPDYLAATRIARLGEAGEGGRIWW